MKLIGYVIAVPPNIDSHQKKKKNFCSDAFGMSTLVFEFVPPLLLGNVLVLESELINIGVESAELGAPVLLQFLLVCILHRFDGCVSKGDLTHGVGGNALDTLGKLASRSAVRRADAPATVAAVSSARSLSRSSVSLEISLRCCRWRSRTTLWWVSSIAAKPRSHVAWPKETARLQKQPKTRCSTPTVSRLALTVLRVREWAKCGHASAPAAKRRKPSFAG